MKRKTRVCLLVLILVVVLSLVFAGCQNQSPEASKVETKEDTSTEAVEETSAAVEADTMAAGSDEVYYMVTFLAGIDFWKGVYAGFEDAAKLYGAKTEYTGSVEYDINEAITVLEQVIVKKPTGMAVACMNPDAYMDPIDRAIDAGIPLVTFDCDSPDSKRYAHLATKNYNGGVLAAEKMAELLDGKGEVGMLVTPGQANLEERADGFKDTMAAKYPDIKIVQEVDGKCQEDVGAQVCAGLIQANPDVAGIYSVNANMGIGAATAVKESGKGGEIKIVSFDVDVPLLELVGEGTIHGLIGQSSWNMGYWSFQFIYMINHSELKPVPGWKESGISPLPAYVDTGVSIVDESNYELYLDLQE